MFLAAELLEAIAPKESADTQYLLTCYFYDDREVTCSAPVDLKNDKKPIFQADIGVGSFIRAIY